MPKKMDRYDQEIKEIVDGEIEVLTAWIIADGLFQFCGEAPCGCLTQVRAGLPGPEGFTSAIRRDTRIPESPGLLEDKLNAAKTKQEKRAVLQPFAEWQRILDEKVRNRNDN